MPGVPRTIEWVGDIDGHVALIDQTLLPGELSIIHCHDVASLDHAIRTLQVRGAPAIGIAAAMGAVLGVRDARNDTCEVFLSKLEAVCDRLAASRPTAVNLCWALDRIKARAREDHGSVSATLAALLDEARRIRDEDAAMCRAIGAFGMGLIQPNFGLLTHCNAGGLATAEYGTALAPMYAAHEAGVAFRVFVDETRPLLQGSRLTAWELNEAGIDVTVLCDNMAARLMQSGQVDLVITGADRIAANGDVANKIGTYGLALLAAAHQVPMYVAAPHSTFDLSLSDGSTIPIEERDPQEIRQGFGRLTVPPGVACYCPAFDVTPARLIRGLITDRGLIEPVGQDTIRRVLSRPDGPCPDT